MKTAFLFLFFFVAASASLLSGHGKLKSYMKVMKADKDFLIKNGNLLRLMNNIMTSNINDDQLDIAKGFMLDQHIDKFDDIEIVKDFIKMTRFGMLPKSKIFSLFDKKQKKEAVTLFRVLYSAKDFETFYRTACWAREHINEGMFIYALTVAIIHRDDTRGMTLPTPYEIKPNLFINTEIITKAQRLKMQGLIQDKKFAESLGIYKFDDTIFIKSNYSGWYTRPNKEIVMTYFTEDIGLNTFLYYLQTTYPTWMGSDDGMITTRRGELFLYTIQQLLARYYMERLSNGLGEIPNFMWTEPIKTGFKSSLRHINGMEFPSRPNDFLLYTDKNIWDMMLIRDYERRISDAIDLGKIETEKGEIVTLRKPEDIEKLGNIIQGNKDNVNSKYFKKGYSVGKKLLGNGDDIIDDFKTNPSVMQKIETTGRDPMFYQFIKKLYHFVLKFKENLKPYKREDVGFDGVMVEDIQVDKLVTFFDYDSVDITNCVPRKLDDIIHGDKFKTLKIKAIQKRLNHLPFNVKIDIKSDKATETVVRIFLGPKYDSLHRRMKLDDNRINFMEIDTFIYDLKMGMNTILRKSRDFFTTKGDFTPTHEVMKKLTGCIHGSDECFVDMANTRTGFPDRLLIPRGTKGGMDMLLYVVITPIRRTKIYGSEDVTGKKVDDKKIKTLDMFTKRLLLDDNAFGFPLDRKIDETIFWNTNMLMRDVTIYHKKDIKVNLIDKDIKHDDDYKMMDLMDKIKLNDNDYDKYDWEDWRDDKMSGWKNTKMSDWTDWKDDKMYGRKDTMMSDWKDWKDDKTYDWKNGKMTDFKDWKNYKNMDWMGDNKIDWTDSRMYDTDNYKKGMNYGKKYDSMEDKMIDSREYTKYGKMYDTDYYSKFDTKHGMKYDSNEDKTHDFKDYTKYGKVYDMDYYRKFDTKHGMKYDSNEDKTHDFKDYTKHGKVYDMDYNKKFDTKYGMKYDSREDKMYDSTENRMYNRRDKMDFMKDKMDFMKDKTDFDDYKMHTLRGNKYGIMDKFYKW